MVLVFFNNYSIRAYECSYKRQDTLQELANNVTYTLDYSVDDNGNYVFKAVFTGVAKDLLVRDNRYNLDYSSYDDEYFGELRIPNLLPGKQYFFSIIGTNECFGTVVRNITIDIANYNPYYNHDLCKNIPEFKLCQKWVTSNISYDEFVTQTNKYLENKKSDGNQNLNADEKSNNIFWIIYQNYYWLILTSLILVLIVIICLWIKENKKNQL